MTKIDSKGIYAKYYEDTENETSERSFIYVINRERLKSTRERTVSNKFTIQKCLFSLNDWEILAYVRFDKMTIFKQITKKELNKINLKSHFGNN